MYNFIIPGLYEHYDLNLQLLRMMNRSSGIFRKDINIYAAYGSFQFSVWNGGRTNSLYRQASYEDIELVRDTFCKQYGIKPRLVFTNSMITEDMLHDRFCNLQLELFSDLDTEIVINSDLLRNYIAYHYPSYKFVSSTTKVIRDTDRMLRELSDPTYSIICLDNTMNYKFDVLSSIPEDLKSKCEILVNERCVDNCPSRLDHYRYMDKYTSSYGYVGDGTSYNCPLGIFDYTKLKSYITPENLYKYSDIGINYFKLVDRSANMEFQAMIYAQYLVLPEYQMDFVHDILNKAKQNMRFRFVNRNHCNGI